jgi:hypothetical protein
VLIPLADGPCLILESHRSSRAVRLSSSSSTR